ncbi:MAG: radical SAM protein [Firmicutes bacterium]|nr:radical SAM protein [Bacillota bacterium]
MPTTTATDALRIVKIQRSCVHDGPGLRATLFFAGCGLRCRWCQNPEALSRRPGEDEIRDSGEIAETLLRDERYYRASGGGVTLSGGEPFLQDSEALLALLARLKERDIRIAAETSLCAPWETIEAAMPYVDLFIADLKAEDAVLHQELTGRDNALIKSNLEQLVSAGAQVKIRTLVVPGLNDGEEAIRALAAYVKSLGFDTIELMKFHNMYEEKAERLGLDVPRLGITPEQSLAALKRAVELYGKCGLRACNDELKDAPPAAKFTDRVLRIQNDIRESGRAVCFEVSRLKTEYYRQNGFDAPVHIHRARRLRYVLERKKTIVYPGELLVGNFTGKRVAGQVWEEQYGSLYAAFLYQAHKQTPVPFQSTWQERAHFYTRIFPYWLMKSTVYRGHERKEDLLLNFSRIAETSTGFNNNFAAIAHFVVNFDRILKLGTMGLKHEIKRAAKEHPENNRDFYLGALICLQALEDWAGRYAAHLADLAEREADPGRRAELEKMSAVCKRVPKYPARTFHEALQSMTFLQIALCIEAYENAVSFGRMDQYLYPYFKRDLEAGRITYDEAKELLCLFILKMDEVIFINDGDGPMGISKLFETLSSDQALTFGGQGRDGSDATNDVTYMLIDACELQPLAVNMCARIHEGSPQRYLDRLAEIYIGGCPMPELFSDNVYIDTLLRHYPDTGLENARDYAIIGCVEPIACDDHFGNTDSANMNVTMPFLQALKGQSHDLWRFDKDIQVEKLLTKGAELLGKKGWLPKPAADWWEANLRQAHTARGLYDYDPPKDMDELLARFQTRLNALAKSILADQQAIERMLQKYFTTPLASSLYRGCVESGKDAYEGGTRYNTAGIQAVGVTDVADSLSAIDELVFKRGKYTLLEIIDAIEANFEGEAFAAVRADLLAVPKFGDDVSPEPAKWVTLVMKFFNEALEQCPYAARNGSYTAGYYALNTNDRYGLKTQALPSGRLKGTPLANSIAPAYAMDKADLFSSLNAVSQVNFRDYAVNGSTVTFTIDAALFPGQEGVRNLGSIFRTFLTQGGMQFQPNVVNRGMLQDAYDHPEKYKYLMVRVAGYCAYFNELSDDLKKIIINRVCYA